MDITDFFSKFFGFFTQLFTMLDTKAVFTAFGVEVSILQVFGALIVVTMVAGIFWRGAKG